MTKDRSEWTNSEDTFFPFEQVDDPENGAALRHELQMFRLNPSPPKADDLQEYIDRYYAEKDDKYIAWFLHYYEAELNTKAMGLVQRYHLPGHFAGLKQAMACGLWLALLDYDPATGVPFLTFKTRILWEQVHEYVRSMRSGYTTPSGKEYAKLREIMQLFRQYGEAQDDDTIHRIAEQAGKTDKTVRSYLAGGLRNERQADFYHTLADEDGAEETAEDVTRNFTWEPESACVLLEQNRALMSAFEALENAERDIVAGHIDFCRECYGNRHEKRTFQELAYRNGLRSAEAAERIYYKALDKLKRAMIDKGFGR